MHIGERLHLGSCNRAECGYPFSVVSVSSDYYSTGVWLGQGGRKGDGPQVLRWMTGILRGVE